MWQKKKNDVKMEKLEFGFFFNKKQRVRSDIITILTIRGVIMRRLGTSCSLSPLRTSEGKMHLNCRKQPVT